jgi:MFS family permease
MHLVQPFKLLFTQVIIQVLALYKAYLYGFTFILLADFSNLWVTNYHESIELSGLNYFSFTIGFALASQICARLNDRIYRQLTERNNGISIPEFRVPLLTLGASIVPIGLFLYGWSAQAHLHWVVPNIGIVNFSAGGLISNQCLTGYTVDAYTR